MTSLPAWRRSWLILTGLLVGAFLVVPTLIVVPLSFSGSSLLRFPPETWSLRWYESFVRSPEWREATVVSLQVALLTTLVATPIGSAAAYGLNEARGRFVRIAFVILLLPLLIPVVLIGVGLFFVFARTGLLNTIAGLVLAHSLLAVPLVAIVVRSALSSFDLNQERVARSLGASRLTAFLTVTLPQIRVSVATGALLAFLTSFDEVVVATFIAGGDATTLTKRMFLALRDEIEPTIAAISTLMIALTFVILLAVGRLTRKV
jgi:putative spermidine/putrescine transport system permease protein